MTRDRRSMVMTAVVGLAAFVTLNLCAAPAGAQPGQGRGGGGFGIDPRAQDRTYHFADTNEDLPYCVFVSSKVSKDKPAPLIISLHGLGAGPQIMCNTTAVDLAEAGGYILAAPMGYNTGGWYGSPVIGGGGTQTQHHERGQASDGRRHHRSAIRCHVSSLSSGRPARGRR